MDIRVSQQEGRVPVTVIQMTGRLNLGTADQLQQTAQQAIERGARDVLLDLSGVESLTSAGLRTIHAIFKMLPDDQDQGGDEALRQSVADGTFRSRHLKLARPTPHVRKVIEIAGFDRFIEIRDDLADALASF